MPLRHEGAKKDAKEMAIPWAQEGQYLRHRRGKGLRERLARNFTNQHEEKIKKGTDARRREERQNDFDRITR